MSGIFKKIAAALLSAFIILLLYSGCYLSLRKSQLYISSYSQLSKTKTLEEFNKIFDSALDFYSPIGQDEVVGAYLGVVVNVINQQNDKKVIDNLAGRAEKRMAPILEKGKGFNFGQNLYTLGMIYRLAAAKLQSEDYYQKSVAMFKAGLEYSPNRMMFLKGLFDLYNAAGDKENAQKVDKKIRSLITNY